jgi:hypothetical protein
MNPPSPACSRVSVFMGASSAAVGVDADAVAGGNSAVDLHRALWLMCMRRWRRGCFAGCGYPLGSTQAVYPARIRVLVFIARSFPVWLDQPSGSMVHPLPARVCVMVIIGRSCRFGAGSAVRVDPVAFARASPCRGAHRRCLQPLGSAP